MKFAHKFAFHRAGFRLWTLAFRLSSPFTHHASRITKIKDKRFKDKRPPVICHRTLLTSNFQLPTSHNLVTRHLSPVTNLVTRHLSHITHCASRITSSNFYYPCRTEKTLITRRGLMFALKSRISFSSTPAFSARLLLFPPCLFI